jgi:hypothetical protein
MEYTEELHKILRENKSSDATVFFDGVCSLKEASHALLDEIERLRSLTRWVPVSERLPEENKLLLLHDRVSSQPVFAYLASGLHGSHWTIENKNYSVFGYQNQYTQWQYVTPPEGEGVK